MRAAIPGLLKVALFLLLAACAETLRISTRFPVIIRPLEIRLLSIRQSRRQIFSPGFTRRPLASTNAAGEARKCRMLDGSQQNYTTDWLQAAIAYRI
jgi:hypothetical protein